MKKTLLILGMLALTPVASFAKRIMPLPPMPQYKYSVKLYNTISYSESQNTLYFSRNEIEQLSFLNPTVAFNWKTKKGNFREIELSALQLGKVTENRYTANTAGVQTYIEGKATNISVRYEYILHLAKRKQWKLNPMVGFAAAPYYQRQETIISFPSSFSGGATKETHVGARAYVVPRLNYNVSNRLFLDLNIPVCLADLSINSIESISNSSASESSTSDFSTLPKLLSARLGIGLRL